MAIRLREIDGCMVALCAAKSVPKDGDVYLDDTAHYALMNKFALDFNENKLWENGDESDSLPFEESHRLFIEQEESNNPNRELWDRTYR
jgi:hypothetical protein